MLMLVAGHQRNGQAVRQLRHEADHLVVLGGRQLTDSSEAQNFADAHTRFDVFLGVLFGRNDNVVGTEEDFFVAVFNAVHLTACHRVGGDKFHAVGQNRLNLIDDAPLDARNIGNHGAFFDVLAVLFYPVDENMRIKRKNDDVRIRDKLRVNLGRRFFDDFMLKRIVNRGLRAGDRIDMIALFGKASCVASAEQS